MQFISKAMFESSIVGTDVPAVRKKSYLPKSKSKRLQVGDPSDLVTVSEQCSRFRDDRIAEIN